MERLRKKSRSVQMMTIPAIIIVILYFIQLQEIDASIQIQHKKLNFPNRELLYDPTSYVDGKLMYATCLTNRTGHEKQCQVVRQKTPYTDDVFSCYFTIKLNPDEKKNYNNWKNFLKPLGENKAIFYTMPEDIFNWNITFKTIQLETCKIFNTDVHIIRPYDPRFLRRDLSEIVTIVPYSESYDIFYQNTTLNDTRKLTINDEGKITAGPIVYANTSAFTAFLPFVVSTSREGGYFYMEHNNDNDDLHKYQFILLKPDGTAKLLGSQTAHYPVTKSATNNYISICFKAVESEPIFKCMQYYPNGKLKLETTIKSIMPRTRISYSHNLPDGGMYVVFRTCKTNKSCRGEDVGLIIAKIDSTGKVIGSLEMNEVKLHPGEARRELAISYYLDENYQNCISFAEFFAAEPRDKLNNSIISSSYCFTEADLSKKSPTLVYP